MESDFHHDSDSNSGSDYSKKLNHDISIPIKPNPFFAFSNRAKRKDTNQIKVMDLLRFSHSAKSGLLRSGFPSGPIRAAFCALTATIVKAAKITNSLEFIMGSL